MRLGLKSSTMRPMRNVPHEQLTEVDDSPSPLAILFSLKGRLTRKNWWLWGVLAPAVASAVIYYLLVIAGLDRTWVLTLPDGTSPQGLQEISAASLIAMVIVAWPQWATLLKRWHDRNRATWSLVVAVLSIVGCVWVLVEAGFLRGTKGPNRFGDEVVDAL